MAPSLSERESFRFRVVQSASDCKKFHNCRSAAACVARNLQTSTQLVRRWVKRELEGEGLHDRSRPGAPRKLSNDAVKRAKDLLLASNTCSTLRKVARRLVDEGHCSTKVSKSTVGSAVKSGKGALQSCHVSSVPALSEEQMRKRVAFAKANRNRPWTKVMFTDSKYFYLNQLAGRKGPKRWVLAGSKPTQAGVKFPSKVHVYAGVSYHGKTDLHFATGTTGLKSTFSKTQRGVGALEYQAVLEQTLLPQARKIFSRHSIRDWTLQQDGAPAHTASSTREFLEQQGIDVLRNWPPNSPDLSWIENIWGWTEQQLRKHSFSTLSELKTVLQKVWNDMPLEVLQANCRSMRDRLKKCIERGGQHVGY